MVALLKEVGTTGAVLTWIKQHNLEAVEAFLAHPTLEEYRIQLPEKMRNQFYDANELWKTRVPTLQSVALEFVKLVKLRFEMVLSTEDFTEPHCGQRRKLRSMLSPIQSKKVWLPPSTV